MNRVLKKSGRPAGRSTTKEQILVAAKERFAQDGYDKTTVRVVAKGAAVDPALVMHYFGSKEELFIAAMAPSQRVPQKIARELADGDPETLGLRLATLFVSMLESRATNHIVVNVLKAAIRIPGGITILKIVLIRPILKVFVDSKLDRAELRATLAQSQLVGLVMVRYILKIEPLASLPPEDLIAYLAPTLQQYLTGDLNNNKKEDV